MMLMLLLVLCKLEGMPLLGSNGPAYSRQRASVYINQLREQCRTTGNSEHCNGTQVSVYIVAACRCTLYSVHATVAQQDNQ
jgi:hypothetical protein